MRTYVILRRVSVKGPRSMPRRCMVVVVVIMVVVAMAVLLPCRALTVHIYVAGGIATAKEHIEQFFGRNVL